MIDLVFWSFVLPLGVLIPLAMGAKSLAILAAISGRDERPGASPIVLDPIRPDSPDDADVDLNPDFLEITCGLRPRSVEDDSSYRDAVAVLDRLFNLDRIQTLAERRYFQDLAEKVYEYESIRRVVASQPSAVESAGRLLLGVALLACLGGSALPESEERWGVMKTFRPYGQIFIMKADVQAFTPCPGKFVVTKGAI